MAISGTYEFAPDLGDIVEEAFERAGLELRSGYDFRTARRSLNLLTLEWQNRGINLWTVEEATLLNSTGGSTLDKSDATYDLGDATISVFDVVLRTNAGEVTTQADYALNRISFSTYATIPNKLTEARPLQYMIDRQEIPGTTTKSTITFWPVPEEDSKYTVLYWRAQAIADAGDKASLNADVPNRFFPALVSGLAYQIAMKRPEAAQRLQFLKSEYEEQFQLAADEDRIKAPVRFVPWSYRS